MREKLVTVKQFFYFEDVDFVRCLTPGVCALRHFMKEIPDSLIPCSKLFISVRTHRDVLDINFMAIGKY